MAYIPISTQESLEHKPESLVYLLELYNPKMKTKEGENLLTLVLKSKTLATKENIQTMLAAGWTIQPALLTGAVSGAVINYFKSSLASAQVANFEPIKGVPHELSCLYMGTYRSIELFEKLIQDNSIEMSKSLSLAILDYFITTKKLQLVTVVLDTPEHAQATLAAYQDAIGRLLDKAFANIAFPSQELQSILNKGVANRYCFLDERSIKGHFYKEQDSQYNSLKQAIYSKCQAIVLHQNLTMPQKSSASKKKNSTKI